MKKVFIILTLTVALLFFYTGCGISTDNELDSPDKTAEVSAKIADIDEITLQMDQS